MTVIEEFGSLLWTGIFNSVIWILIFSCDVCKPTNSCGQRIEKYRPRHISSAAVVVELKLLVKNKSILINQNLPVIVTSIKILNQYLTSPLMGGDEAIERAAAVVDPRVFV